MIVDLYILFAVMNRHNVKQEEENGSILLQILSLCWPGDGLYIARDRTQLTNKDGYRWISEYKVLQITSWVKMFGKAPIPPDKRTQNPEYLRYLETMQQKLAGVLFKIISQYSLTFNDLSEVTIELAEEIGGDVAEYKRVLNDFFAFIKLFSQKGSWSNIPPRPSLHSRLSKIIASYGEHNPEAEFQEKAMKKVDGWITHVHGLSAGTQEYLKGHRKLEKGSLVPQEILADLRLHLLLPHVISGDEVNWYQVINYGHDFPSKSHIPFQHKGVWKANSLEKVEKWIKKHKISQKTADAIRNAESNIDDPIPPSVLEELTSHATLSSHFKQKTRGSTMTWRELGTLIENTH